MPCENEGRDLVVEQAARNAKGARKPGGVRREAQDRFSL
jgi:hypothetical protein